jgi:hypothetical protein
MAEPVENSFSNKCAVLSDLWMQYRFDKKFGDFVDYNDIGLPLSFLVDEELVKPAPLAKQMIEETYSLLLAALEREDGDYESIEDVMLG